MKIVCNKTLLVNAINTSQKAVSGKSTIQILEGLYLEAANNKLKIVGNDLEIGIESTIECEVEEAGSIVLNSRMFGEIVRKLPEGNVSIVSDEQYNTLIKSKNSKFNIKGITSADYPLLPSIESSEFFQISQDLLKNMIRQTIFAVSTDENKQILTGSLFEIDNNDLNIVSVDGYRLAQRKARVLSDKNLSAVIPGKTLNEVYKILEQEEQQVSITIGKNQILFEFGNCRVVSRLLEGKFLNYKEIIPKEFETKAKLNTKELLESVERASLISREDKKYPVKFNLGDEKIMISSYSEIGNVQEEVAANIEGKDLEIGFNPKYFMDALRAVEYDDITLNFTTSYGPCVIESPQEENFIYLILPVRLK
jgi:DNA polymerase-3 subunit beta